MAARITELCEQSDDALFAFGAAARDFVLREKSPAPQGARLLAFLNSDT
jgi:hypothetical protein